MRKLVESQYFTVYYWNLNGKASLVMDKDFFQVSVISGDAKISIGNKAFDIGKGKHFIILYGIKNYLMLNQAEFIVSHS